MMNFKPVLSDHKNNTYFLLLQTGGCILLNESVPFSLSNQQPTVNSGFHVT